MGGNILHKKLRESQLERSTGSDWEFVVGKRNYDQCIGCKHGVACKLP